MSSNQFQSEYIEYLQERNTELSKKLTHMKENYENKIFSKDINKHLLNTVLEDVLTFQKNWTVMSKEIESVVDKMKGAMDSLKDILIKESGKMMQLAEKISQVMDPTGNSRENLMEMDGSGFVKESNFDTKFEKKCGTVKISPMINGHLISTIGPKIYLNKISKNFPPGIRNEDYQLPPIVEVSPNTSLDASGIGESSKELRYPLERINFNCINMDSPKSRFKGPEAWKESLMTKKQQADTHKNEIFVEDSENLNRKPESVCMEEPRTTENEEDPLEGPSWLYASSPNTRCNTFVDCRPRKHRFAAVFDRNADFKESLDEKKNVSMLTETDSLNETLEDLICLSWMEKEENDLSSVKKINLTSSCEEEKPGTPEKRNGKKSEPEECQRNEVYVKLSDCKTSKKVKGKRSKMSPAESKKTSTKNKRECNSPYVVHPENEGRKRRNAAPTNLREPSLVGKLRRE